MEDKIVLRLRHKLDEYLDIVVDDPDKCNILDVFIELLEGAAKKGICLPENPTLWYVHESKSRKLEWDKNLLEMFSLLHDKKLIKIAVGSTESPCENLVLARGLIESKMSSVDTNLPSSHHTIPSTGYMGETQSQPNSQLPRKAVSFDVPVHDLPNHGTIAPSGPNDASVCLLAKKIPATSARRKGIYVPKGKTTSSGNELTSGSHSQTRERLHNNDNMGDDNEEFVGFDSEDDDYVPSDNAEEEEEDPLEILRNEDELVEDGDTWLCNVDDGYNPERSNEWKFDKENYFDRLYENGEFYADNRFGDIVLRQWMIFFDKDHFTSVLREFCIQEGFFTITTKSDMSRLTATCASTSCDWRIHASRLPDGHTWAIKSLSGVHTCSRLFRYNPMATVSWAVEKLLEDFRSNRKLSGKDINDKLFKEYGINLRKTALYNTKKFALMKLDGDHDTSYSKLPAYCEVLKGTNPGCKAHCAWKVAEELPEKPIQFKSIFVSFKPMIEGFRGCRALIGIDGAHLKGNYGGVLLSAVAVDGNNEIFPLAYGIYDNESKSTWSSFLFHLKDILKDDARDNLTIVSDRQKGIEAALDDIWPTISRRYCCRHLCANFKKVYPGKLMHQLFWGVCDAYSEFCYNKAVEKLEKLAGWGAVKWLHETGDIERWARHKFDPTLCSDENTSNFAESFNSTIGVDRESPVLSLLEGIRRTHMVRYVGRQENAQNMSLDGITPKIALKLNYNERQSRSMKVLKASQTECEVKDGFSFLPVNLTNRTCACVVWQISGIPCKHAVRAIKELRTGVPLEEYVAGWFSTQAYKIAYQANFHPVPDEEQWSVYDLPKINPPTMKRGIGRPSRNRKREEGEVRKGKRSGTVRCGKCKAFGHNAKTCKGGMTARELKGKGVNVEQSQRQRKRKVRPEQSELEGDVMASAPWQSS